MCNKRFSKSAITLINLTKHTLTLYDKTTGEIVSIKPSKEKLPTMPFEHDDTTYYVVTKKIANRIKHSGRPLHDIAILHPYLFIGHDHTPLNYLLWGENHHKEVIYVPYHHI